MILGARILIIIVWIAVLIFGHDISASIIFGNLLFIVILKILFFGLLYTYPFSSSLKFSIASIETLASLLFLSIFYLTEYIDFFSGWPNQIFYTLVELSAVGLILTLVYRISDPN
jgi:hypothetical protein